MGEPSALKLRLLERLRTEKRGLDYFSAYQQRVVLELMADELVKIGRDRNLVITTKGRNVLKANQ